MAKNKHFIMVLWGDFSRRLEIPQNFLKHMEEDPGKRDKGSIPAKLVDSSGRTWQVLIERTTNGTHFTSGWPKFVGDHKLKENEFLVFRYDGTQQFSVTIFDLSLCEREPMIREEVTERVLEVMSLSDSEESEGSDMILEEVAKRTQEVISLSDSEGSEESESDEEEEEDENEDSLARSKFKRRGASSLSPPHPSSSRKKKKGQYVSRRRAVTHLEKQKATNIEESEESESDEEEEEDENEHSLAKNKFRKRGASSLSPPHPSSLRKKKKGQFVLRHRAVTHLEKQKATNIEGNEESESDEEEEEDENEDDDTDDSLAGKKFKKKCASSLSPPHLSSSRKQMRGQYVSRRRAVTNLEKQRAVEAAYFFTSKNPHCMRHMTANLVYRWSLMRFPVHFSSNHLPHEKTECILKNSAGKEWIGSYNIESKSSRGVISSGWAHFARDNNLEEDDYCVFELVNSTHPEFLVHIFRVVEKVVPAVWIKNK